MKRNQKQHAKRQRHKEAKASEVQAVYSEDGKLAKQIVKQNQVSGDDFLGDISQPAQKSVLFQQYRALGYYASDLPLSIVKSDQDILIASAVGEHAFYVYDSAHLNLAYMSKFISDTITFIQATSDGFVYTSLSSGIIAAWKKMHKVQELIGHSQPIIKFIAFSDFVFSLAEQGEFIVFNRFKGTIIKKIQFDTPFDDFLHPSTYINKLIFSHQGNLELWNVMSEQKVFTFSEFEHEGNITCLEQSPVVDIVAVGFESGAIVLLNLLYNEQLLKFNSGGPVKALTFSSDTSLGVSLLASITQSKQGGSEVVFWDLNAKKIYSTLSNAHQGKQISDIKFMQNEPVLISSSQDGNSIKMWLFDKGLTVPRLMRQRTGHADQPTRIRFYGGQDDPVMHGARNLISCSNDGQLRDISLLNEFQSMDFSQKNLNKGLLRNEEGSCSLGKIKQFGFSEFRERDWQNVLTCHSGAAQPYMWSYANHSISKVNVSQSEILKNTRVTSVAVSQCGNFGVLGYLNGQIQKFNLQSGLDRGLFAPEQHSSEVTGLGIDALNHYLVSSSFDGKIKLWDFYKAKHIKTFSLESPIENLVYNRKNDLVAVSTSDLSVSILNIKNGLKRVRCFDNVAQNKITDICFSQPDSKWLLCSSLDKSLKVFDILTGSLIDWIQFQSAPLSIDFSLSGEFLATSHVGSKAVYLWSNRAFFQNIVIQKVPTEAVSIELPSHSSSETVKESHKDFYLDEEREKIVAEAITSNLIDQKFSKTKQQSNKISQELKSAKFMSLSNQPYQKWQAIFNLEQIKERNKPTLAKQELPKAPFFLFDLDKVMAAESNTVPKELLKQTFFTQEEKLSNKLEQHGFQKKLRAMLKQGSSSGEITEYLKSISASGVELELISLSSLDFDDSKTLEYPNQLLLQMMHVLMAEIEQNRDTDFIHACLNNFLQNHHELIVEDEKLSACLSDLKETVNRHFKEVENVLNSSVCMSQYFAGLSTF